MSPTPRTPTPNFRMQVSGNVLALCPTSTSFHSACQGPVQTGSPDCVRPRETCGEYPNPAPRESEHFTVPWRNIGRIQLCAGRLLEHVTRGAAPSTPDL